MRRTVILAALPLLAAAPARIDNEPHLFLTDNLLGSHATGQRIEVRSWQWGSREQEPQAGIKDLKAEDKMGDPVSVTGHSMLGASDKVTAGGVRTENQATGKRVHKPFRARMVYDQAQPQGSLTVRGGFPGCTVGERYGGMQFAAGGKIYDLQDVTVADCPASLAPTETFTLVYGKVKVRGWDPEKKEL